MELCFAFLQKNSSCSLTYGNLCLYVLYDKLLSNMRCIYYLNYLTNRKQVFIVICSTLGVYTDTGFSFHIIIVYHGVDNLF
jgi:hypothetical protein